MREEGGGREEDGRRTGGETGGGREEDGRRTGGGREEDGRRTGAAGGYRSKNKNSTRQCGEQIPSTS